jgi:hypothetical protein
VWCLLEAVLAVALALGGAQSAAKPDFSGDWKMNAAKSDFGAVPAPSLITRKITHAEPALTIVEEQRSDLGDQLATRKYTTNGSPSVFNANGADVTTSATWDGTTLVVVSKVDVIGLTYHDRMSLAADRKTLTSLVRVSSADGDLEMKVVFERQ